MIVVKLTGGLGNQIFQYAAGRALAERHRTELYLDLSFLKSDPRGGYTKRDFELDQFNINAKIADTAELAHFNFNSSRLAVKLKSLFPSAFQTLVFNESQPGFDARFFKLPATTYLNGYWQDQTYFLKIRELLLQELTLLHESDTYKNLQQVICSGQSVSIHVRRGDYVTLPAASQFHGTPGLDYYKKAAAYFEQMEKDVHFFIFTDDTAWCEEQFNFLKTKTLVSSQPGLNAQQELLLMSKCRHQIIANSSFSWWGAWLNTNAGKKIIAPDYWFAGKKSSQLSILPKDWQTMKLSQDHSIS